MPINRLTGCQDGRLFRHRVDFVGGARLKRQEYASGEATPEVRAGRPRDAELGKLLKQISRQVADDRSRAVTSLFQIAERYEVLRPHLSASELCVYLADVCDIPQSQVRVHAACSVINGTCLSHMGSRRKSC